MPETLLYEGSAERYRDESVASGTEYFYQLRVRGSVRAQARQAIPAERLGSCRRPELRIDKGRYSLEVWDEGRLRKRYPVALGRDPRKRKLNQDNASTPEGNYRISVLQSTATYYRAFDLDYPNSVDRARYQLLHPGFPIGGEIQIHGKGISRNWTFGCVALRNQDMDELFGEPSVSVGTPVRIYGGELELGDLLAPAPAGWTPAKVGNFQRSHGLKVTCLWDRETRRVGKRRA